MVRLSSVINIRRGVCLVKVSLKLPFSSAVLPASIIFIQSLNCVQIHCVPSLRLMLYLCALYLKNYEWYIQYWRLSVCFTVDQLKAFTCSFVCFCSQAGSMTEPQGAITHLFYCTDISFSATVMGLTLCRLNLKECITDCTYLSLIVTLMKSFLL